MSASAVLKLQKVGFTVDQVEALADFMDTQAASKADLIEAKSELKADIAEIRNELKADIAEIRNELKVDIARVESNVAAAKIDILKTIIGVMVVNSAVVLAAMFGLAKLLGH